MSNALVHPLVLILTAIWLATAAAWAGLRRRIKRHSAEVAAAREILDEVLNDEWVFLSQSSKSLSLSLDYRETLANIASLAVPGFADSCTVDLLEEAGQIRRVRSQNDRSLHEEVLSLDTESENPLHEIIRQGEPRQFNEVNEALLNALAGSPDQLAVLRKCGLRSALAVPLLSTSGTIGVITFALARPGKRYSTSDMNLAKQLAVRAGLAVENARLFQKEQLAVRARDQLLAVVSHELKNPLTVVDLQAELLLSRNLDNEFSRPLGIIRGATKSMKRLIQDLLDANKIETGRLMITLAPVPLTPLLHEALESMKPLAEKRCIKLSVEIAPDAQGQIITADHDRFIQILTNILGNAIKFSPADNEVSMHVFLQNGNTALISIRDKGPGMTADMLARAFTQYAQDPSTAHLGSGLGLYISKAIVDRHHGTIEIESAVNAGTTVKIAIPILS